MNKGEKLFRSLAALISREFYGTVTIELEGGRSLMWRPRRAGRGNTRTCR